MSQQVLAEIRSELETIRRTAEIALEKLASLGAGFGSVSGVPRVPVEGGRSAVDQVRDVLPYYVLSQLSVIDQGGVVTIRSKEWLKGRLWGEVDDKVKQMGGRWIRDGKASRWEVSVP